ncbi:MAG: hypothetical protein JRC91_11745 [Deltaproteobacteria bacterium]|nr:hypothetical protein [Deltaproteobacteria bacterium]
MVLAGPWHPAFGHLVFSELFYDRVCNTIDQSPDLLTSEKLVVTVHPKSESRLRGDKNTNLKRLGERYPSLKFSIHPDATVSAGQVDIKPDEV